MSSFRLPGLVCRFLNVLEIDSGTLCRSPSSRPGLIAPTTNRTSGLDVDRAIAYLDSNAADSPTYWCARAIYRALKAGGFAGDPMPEARQYGQNLVAAGFVLLSQDGYIATRGDIVVFQASATVPEGHIAMYDGAHWVSDYRQTSMYPGGTWKDVPYSLYRP